MRMVAPRTGAPEVTLAEDQLEYRPLTVAAYQHNDRPGKAFMLLSRWRLSDEERRRIAAGEDLYLAVCTFGDPMQPVSLQVGPDGYLVADAG